MSQNPEGFTELLLTLTRMLVDEESVDDTLRRVAYLACKSPVGADAAGVTLQRDGGPITPAFYGERAQLLDAAQYTADDGPCLTAYRTGETIRLDSIATESERWPAFAEQAAVHGVQSSLSLPLAVGERRVGALNLYAMALAPFTDESITLAHAFAQQAAVALGNAEIYWRTHQLTQNLELALENRDRIGQAKGILLVTHKISGDEAFDLLRTTSQHMNIKLREVADYVVRTGDMPDGNA